MTKASRNIVFGDELQQHINRGIEQVYEVAKAAYGPGAGNALLELPYGDPLISRDGVTNVEKVYLENPIENMAARIVIQASRKNNRKVGDGTTAVVILAYHLYQEATKLLYAGYNRMAIAKLLDQAAVNVIKRIDELKIPVTDALLKHVAIVSAGDEAIGHMIADVISEIGTDGGVTVEDFGGIGIYNELVDGFYFRKGFTNVNLTNDPSNLESRHTDIDIFITEKRMATVADLAPILDKIIATVGKGKELLLIGDVAEEVQNMLLLNRMAGTINVTVADMPVFGSMRSLALEDLALVTGGKVYLPGGNAQEFNINMLGGAQKVIINEFSTTLIDGDGSGEDIAGRITELREQLSNAESTVSVNALKERLARLTGKVAIIRVGGATEVEQGEVKLRVQDAICAVQAAITDGIVPGGGVTLARVNPFGFSDNPPFIEAFKQPFRTLVTNAGYDDSQALWTMLKKPNWYGYNLKENIADYKPVDLLKAGIIDPASVTKEVVRNATSVVAKLITASVSVAYVDREQKHD
jgi:chaperonin GroEL